MWSWHIKVLPNAHAERTGTIVLEMFGLLALKLTSGTFIMTEACSTDRANTAVWTHVSSAVVYMINVGMLACLRARQPIMLYLSFFSVLLLFKNKYESNLHVCLAEPAGALPAYTHYSHSKHGFSEKSHEDLTRTCSMTANEVRVSDIVKAIIWITRFIKSSESLSFQLLETYRICYNITTLLGRGC